MCVTSTSAESTCTGQHLFKQSSSSELNAEGKIQVCLNCRPNISTQTYNLTFTFPSGKVGMKCQFVYSVNAALLMFTHLIRKRRACYFTFTRWSDTLKRHGDTSCTNTSSCLFLNSSSLSDRRSSPICL